MKCEREGCEEKAAHGATFGRLGGPVVRSIVGLCEHHLADVIRGWADEVEGVKECEECDGCGMHESEQSDNMFWRCDKCHGTGRVKA